MGTASFSGVRQPGRGAEQPTQFSAQIEERIKLYISHVFLHGML